MKNVYRLAAATLALIACQGSHAAIVDSGSGPQATTTNADAAFLAWQGRLGSFSTDQLTGLAGAGNGTNNANLVSNAGNRFQSINSTVANGADQLFSTTENTGVVSGTTLGTYSVVGSTLGAADFRWTLAQASNAFGFFAWDLDGATLTVDFVDGTAQTYNFVTANAEGNNVFWGISGLNSNISSVLIKTNASSGTTNWYDRFSIGTTLVTQVPEPGSLALVGLALVGVGLSRRKS